MQIGEHKYGEPVLGRAINYEMDIYDALKVGLISIDSIAALEPLKTDLRAPAQGDGNLFTSR